MIKLENIKEFIIDNEQSVKGGDSGMGIDETAANTCECVKFSGCSGYTWPDGTFMATGGTWNED
jgi:hypothetical protein